ncbi:MAG: TolB family protein [Acidobacteriaceae bacterium]
MALLTAAIPILLAQPTATTRHGITLDDLAKLHRVGEPQVSPDGLWIAYTVTTINVAEDKSLSQLWMVSWDGKQDIQLTFDKDDVGSPQWSQDGRWLAFTSDFATLNGPLSMV